jgi:SAM-dependent methyltransferase
MGKFLMRYSSNSSANKMIDRPELLKPVAHSYEWSINKYGPTHRATAWRDEKRQQRRFDIFSGLLAHDSNRDNVTINDLGCGYGAMFNTYRKLSQFTNGKYFGYDISTAMIKAAEKKVSDPRARFILSHKATENADYSFVSGTYNMKMAADDDEWLEYIEKNIVHLWSKTKISMGFNMLNIASPLREKTLYYADPNHFIKFCEKNLRGSIHMIDLLSPNEFVLFIIK